MSATTTVVTETMRPRDLDEVVALDRAWRTPRDGPDRGWSRDLFAAELTHDDRSYVVARAPAAARDRPSGVLGYGGVLVAAGEAHILTVAVAPHLRRAGIGTALLHALVAAARDLGADRATLEVRESNTAAQALYRRLGFVAVGVRPGYYRDDGGVEGAVIMWCEEL